jgi:hypothetical protein
LKRLAAELFGSFIRSEAGRGFLADLGDEERDQAVAAFRREGGASTAAAIAFAALRGAEPEERFAWQAFLVPGLAWRVFEADEEAAALAASFTGITVTASELGARLEDVARYINDDRWCEDVAARYATGKVQLRSSGNPFFPHELVFEPTIDLLTDQRVVAIASAVLEYRRTTGVRLRAGADVIVVAVGTTLATSVRGRMQDGVDLVTLDVLEALAARGGAFIDLLPADRAVAS